MAFVDVGVHQDGLVHVSKLSHDFVEDPHQVVKAGQVVKVKVSRSRSGAASGVVDDVLDGAAGAGQKERPVQADRRRPKQGGRQRDRAPRQIDETQPNHALGRAFEKLKREKGS